MIRAVPTATVSSPPPTAANRMATPSGRLQCKPKNVNGVSAVFWEMKTSKKIRIRKPAIKAVHSAPARVKPMAGSFDLAPGMKQNHAGSLCGAFATLPIVSAV